MKRLVATADQRAARLDDLSGMNPMAVEALTIVPAGSLQPALLSERAGEVRSPMKKTASNRIARLQRAGFEDATARYVSDLHTPTAPSGALNP